AAFMSPEQAAAGLLTEATDWYAVGVMLFQVLTGRLPFHGPTLEVLRRKQRADAPAPAELVIGIPADLNALCVELLRRDPTARPCGREVLARLSGRAGAPTTPGPEAVPFVGRADHLAEFARAFDEARASRTVVCRVEGRSGVGKSLLLRHFLNGPPT